MTNVSGWKASVVNIVIWKKEKTRASFAIHNVAYKYNLLLVLKILSYNFYNNWTDEMQAVAEEQRVHVCACVDTDRLHSHYTQ